MMTAFLNGGEIISRERLETTLDKCVQAREEAIRFNNRFLWPWQGSETRVFVACLYHPDTKEA